MGLSELDSISAFTSTVTPQVIHVPESTTSLPMPVEPYKRTILQVPHPYIQAMLEPSKQQYRMGLEEQIREARLECGQRAPPPKDFPTESLSSTAIRAWREQRYLASTRSLHNASNTEIEEGKSFIRASGVESWRRWRDLTEDGQQQAVRGR